VANIGGKPTLKCLAEQGDLPVFVLSKPYLHYEEAAFGFVEGIIWSGHTNTDECF
jgi:hypothetical protein